MERRLFFWVIRAANDPGALGALDRVELPLSVAPDPHGVPSSPSYRACWGLSPEVGTPGIYTPVAIGLASTTIEFAAESLFPEMDQPEQSARLAPRLKCLATEGIYSGTSSWKYPGWLGSIYAEGFYKTRRKFSQKKFDETCLAEFARIAEVDSIRNEEAPAYAGASHRT